MPGRRFPFHRTAILPSKAVGCRMPPASKVMVGMVMVGMVMVGLPVAGCTSTASKSSAPPSSTPKAGLAADCRNLGTCYAPLLLADRDVGHDLGLVNPVIYRIGRSPACSAAFHAITTETSTVQFPTETITGYQAGYTLTGYAVELAGMCPRMPVARRTRETSGWLRHDAGSRLRGTTARSAIVL